MGRRYKVKQALWSANLTNKKGATGRGWIKGVWVRVSEDNQEGNHAVMDLSAGGFKPNWYPGGPCSISGQGFGYLNCMKEQGPGGCGSEVVSMEGACAAV